MPLLTDRLILDRCPHCGIAHPNLDKRGQVQSGNHLGQQRIWAFYFCATCGGAVSAWATGPGASVNQYFPSESEVSDDIPDRPRAYLQQAHDSIHAPAGCIMLAASAVDAMLKLRGYPDGSLYSRIEKAAKEHVITEDMAAWAHEVRLDANDQRHADEEADLPETADAQRVLRFATVLADLLFVLPAQIQRGREDKG
jgi:hypothetical protein